MIKQIIGIDPGKKTGVALIQKDIELYTTDFWGCVDFVENFEPHETVIVIEVPKTKHVWHTGAVDRGSIARTGMNVGMVLREAELLKDRFSKLGYTLVAMSPQGKCSADQAKELTGYDKRSNQHERDALMMAWNYKHLLGAKSEKKEIRASSQTKKEGQ